MADALRPITVDGHRLRWRFDGHLVVIPEGRSGPTLRVDWGWRDWLEPDGPGEEPRIVTPAFVAQAARFALAHGWNPAENGPPLKLDYGPAGFRLADDHRSSIAPWDRPRPAG